MDDYTEEQLEEFVHFGYKICFCQTKQISATIIQRLWRSYKYKKAIYQTVPSRREPIIVFFTSMPHIQKIKSDTDKSLFVLLNGKRLPYFKFDLIDNKMAQNWVKDQLNHFQLPFIKIHGYFIGTYEDFLKLFELDFIKPIVSKDFLKRCLLCDKPRENQATDAKCEKCERPYLFFKK